MGSKVLIKLTMTALALLCLGVPASAQSRHILQSGETLYSLSRQYGVSVGNLLEANGIGDPSSLSVGTELIIPGIGPAGAAEIGSNNEYTVKKGDTYYSIARSRGMFVDDLLAMNGRTADRVLRIGETLIVSSAVRGIAVVPERIRPAPGSVEVTRVPWWPVAGTKTPLDGKLVGVSIEADPRSYVHAVSDGQVVWTGPYRGFGHVVLVDSNGYIYLYGGNEDLFVNVGQAVATGSRIGRLGAPGPDGAAKRMIFSVFREGIPVSPDEAPRG